MRKLLFLLLLSTISFAQDISAGRDYQLIPMSALAPNQPKDTVEVLEFFSYTCHWCGRIQGALKPWRATLNKNITFRQVPVVFGKGFLPYAKAFYVAEQTKNPEDLHQKLFNYIQENQGRLTSDKDLITLFEKWGVEKPLISSLLSNSIALEAYLSRDEQVLKAYKIMAIPSFVVAGRYRVDPSMVDGDLDKLFVVIRYLINKAQSS